MKRLIFLFDGTWNSAATGQYADITNIFRLNLAISRSDVSKSVEIPQITFYFPGPGSRGKFDREMGGIFGQGMDQIIREAYVNLSSNYVEGDEIYIFGYSRGSVAARALSCLIAESGLLKPQELHRLASAWNRFVSINSGEIQSQHPSEIQGHVHKNVRIKFAGLFDSVLGRNERKSGKFSQLVFKNNNISPIIDHGVHILSVDDSRKIFMPMLWGDRKDFQKVEQIWMPGVHSDIGGYGKPKFIGIASLLTMISKVKSCGIAFNDAFVKTMMDRMINMDSMSIRSEREGVTGYLFRSQFRAAGTSQHTEMKHCLMDVLFNKKFHIKSRRKIYYNQRHLSGFMSLPRDLGDYDKFIVDCAMATLART